MTVQIDPVWTQIMQSVVRLAQEEQSERPKLTETQISRRQQALDRARTLRPYMPHVEGVIGAAEEARRKSGHQFTSQEAEAVAGAVIDALTAEEPE